MVATRTRSRVTLEREKWDKVFNSLLKIVKDLQSQNDEFLQQRNCLEDVIKTQQERWVFDVRLLEDQLSEMEDTLVGKDMELVLAGRKCDLLTGLKEREFSLWKLKSECAEDELDDFKELVGYLHSAKSPARNLIEAGSSRKTRSGELVKSADSKMLKAEVKRLKLEHQQLSSEMSILLKEKNFVWNQYNLLESNLSNKLKSKKVEAEQANEKIAHLLARMEVLQSSNSEKDEQIVSLKANMIKLEANANRWKDEVSHLEKQLDLIRRSGSSQVTPVLNHCSTRAKTANLGTSKGLLSARNVHVKKKPSSVQATTRSKHADKENRSSKRKQRDAIVISDSDTPKLFSSTFKVPKLKTPTPG